MQAIELLEQKLLPVLRPYGGAPAKLVGVAECSFCGRTVECAEFTQKRVVGCATCSCFITAQPKRAVGDKQGRDDRFIGMSPLAADMLLVTSGDSYVWSNVIPTTPASDVHFEPATGRRAEILRYVLLEDHPTPFIFTLFGRSYEPFFGNMRLNLTNDLMAISGIGLSLRMSTPPIFDFNRANVRRLLAEYPEVTADEWQLLISLIAQRNESLMGYDREVRHAGKLIRSASEAQNLLMDMDKRYGLLKEADMLPHIDSGDFQVLRYLSSERK